MRFVGAAQLLIVILMLSLPPDLTNSQLLFLCAFALRKMGGDIQLLTIPAVAVTTAGSKGYVLFNLHNHFNS